MGKPLFKTRLIGLLLSMDHHIVIRTYHETVSFATFFSTVRKSYHGAWMGLWHRFGFVFNVSPKVKGRKCFSSRQLKVCLHRVLLDKVL